MSDLVRLARGVWRPADQIDTLAGRIAALLTACPPGTVVSGISAALLHGVWLPPTIRNDRLHVILHPEIEAQPNRSACRRGEIHARRRALAPADVTTVHGIPVTTPARTWFDLASKLSLPDLVAAGDSTLRLACSQTDLMDVVTRLRHHPGVVKCRALLPDLNGRSRSRPESHLRYALISTGLPQPRVNEAIYTEHGEWLAEPDLSYDDVRLAIEYNGSDHADLDRMRRDITRQVDVLGSGWLSVVAGPVETFRRPDQFAALVAGLRLDRGADRPGRRRPARSLAR